VQVKHQRLMHLGRSVLPGPSGRWQRRSLLVSEAVLPLLERCRRLLLLLLRGLLLQQLVQLLVALLQLMLLQLQLVVLPLQLLVLVLLQRCLVPRPLLQQPLHPLLFQLMRHAAPQLLVFLLLLLLLAPRLPVDVLPGYVVPKLLGSHALLQSLLLQAVLRLHLLQLLRQQQAVQGVHRPQGPRLVCRGAQSGAALLCVEVLSDCLRRG